MRILLLLSLFLGLLAVIPAQAQKKKKRLNQTIENIIRKYKALNAKAAYVKANGVPVAKATRFIQPEDKLVPDYSQLHQIALVRHGEPDLVKTGKFSYREARKFLLNYDSVGIIVPDKPFFHIKAPDQVAIFTSSINRAQATAKYLFGDSAQMTVSPDFREFETNVGRHYLKLRMPIKLWTTSARIKWMLGIDSHGIESFAAARKRARKAAVLLAKATEEKPKVILVAHGFLNRYIKEDLQKLGWQVVRDGGSNYFATTILVKIEDKKEQKEHNISLGSTSEGSR
ncbi:phosphoglycerate mutase family protein [Pontibacter chitinilyticus]|uniref:phosphoglycerate mutase family protein n=1 Tax=Pontibacter chitinilyticus TaxID=2674989 RepID=UPI00321B9A35